MARDFLASQLRTSQIIASRSLALAPSLSIISSSNANGLGLITNGGPPDSSTFVFISGSKGTDAFVVFGGSVKISGSLTVFNNSILSGGLTGSLQSVPDGSPYLAAGAGISLSTASNGQVTISATGAAAGGTDTQVQFNDGGILSGDSGLTYNKTTKTLSIGNLLVTGSVTAVSTSNLTISDAIIYIASGSVGPNSRSVIAFASGSTSTDKSLILGSLGANDTIVAARQDVSGGLISQSSLSFIDLIPVRASKFELGTSIALTSSDGASATFFSAGSGFINLVPGSIGLKLGNSSSPVAISGSNVRIGGSNFPPSPSSDTFFFVSGSLDATNKSVFGGDVLISGSLNQGRLHTAGGLYSHAEGWNNSATGNYSHAEGVSTVASGLYSHAEGNDTNATGEGSHAEGDRTTSAGSYSHAEGLLTTAAADYSHAAGLSTIASGSYSYAGGQGTISSGSYQHVIGRYNNRGNNSALFIIGNGLADSDANRSDVIRVLSGNLNNGRVEVIGALDIVGNLFASGSTHLGDSAVDSVFFNARLATNIIPDSDVSRNLGSATNRFANIYTGDLHLRNDRGDYTLIEESDCLTIRFNKTGKRYKFLLEPVPEYDEDI